MKKHQRYFPVLDEQSALKPNFITVSNGVPGDADLVVKGNENVIRARYADAEFFYKDDTSKKLGDFLPRLDTLIFQGKTRLDARQNPPPRKTRGGLGRHFRPRG